MTVPLCQSTSLKLTNFTCFCQLDGDCGWRLFYHAVLVNLLLRVYPQFVPGGINIVEYHIVIIVNVYSYLLFSKPHALRKRHSESD